MTDALAPTSDEVDEILRRPHDDELQRVAFRAAREARKMEPMLTTFARIAADDETVSVFFGPGAPATDGKRIRLRPPVALGRVPEHNRMLCGTRDRETLIQACPACDALDFIYSSFFHEIAHLVGDSFDNLDDEDKAELVMRAVHERPSLREGDRIDKLQKLIGRIDRRRKLSYVMVCKMISPFMHPIVNSLEDSRVNRIMYRARRGTKNMFRAKAWRVFNEGIEQFDGNVMHWHETPLNSQIIIGLFCLGSKYEFDGYFADEVEEALRDDKLVNLVRALDTARNIKSVYRQAFPILERLRELGFCITDEDVEDDPPPPDESDDDDTESDGTDDADGAGSESDDDESDADDESEAESSTEDGDVAEQDDRTEDEKLADDLMDESGDQGPSGDIDGDDDGDDLEPGDDDAEGEAPTDGTPDYTDRGSDEDALKHLERFGDHYEDDSYDPEQEDEDAEMDAALIQEENFDEPSSTMTGVDTIQYPGGVWHDNDHVTQAFVDKRMPPSGLITSNLFRARLAFAENKRAKRRGGYRSGRPQSHRLATVPTGNDKVFSRSKAPGKRDYFVCVGLDVSGSTTGREIELIRRLGLALGELFDKLGVGFAMYAFTGDGSYRSGYVYELQMHEVKGPHSPWGDMQRKACASLNPGLCNLDGHTLEYLRKVCDASSATDKIILYTSDGSMPAENYSDELRVLKREIEECDRRGYLLRGVGVNTDAPTEHGLETVKVRSVEDIKLVIDAIEKELR